MQLVFVVDDEENIRNLINQYLIREDFLVELFGSAEEVIHRLNFGFPDLFIMDIMLPGEDGLDLCRYIRQQSGVPVIFISARSEEPDRILGLELGGDDYLSKPFSPRELMARVRSVLRRTTAMPYPSVVLEAGNIKIQPSHRRVMVAEQEVMLTPKEFEMLLLFVQYPAQNFNRQMLLDRIWGYDYLGDGRAVDELVKRLRKKLRNYQATKNIKTIWGYGYRLDD